MGMMIEEYESSDLMAENEFLRKQLAEALKHRRMFEADYENRLKADMAAMLEDLQLEIVEHEESIIGPYSKETKESDFPLHKIERNNGRKECIDLIQQRINALRGGENEGNA